MVCVNSVVKNVAAGPQCSASDPASPPACWAGQVTDVLGPSHAHLWLGSGGSSSHRGLVWRLNWVNSVCVEPLKSGGNSKNLCLKRSDVFAHDSRHLPPFTPTFHICAVCRLGWTPWLLFGTRTFFSAIYSCFRSKGEKKKVMVYTSKDCRYRTLPLHQRPSLLPIPCSSPLWLVLFPILQVWKWGWGCEVSTLPKVTAGGWWIWICSQSCLAPEATPNPCGTQRFPCKTTCLFAWVTFVKEVMPAQSDRVEGVLQARHLAGCVLWGKSFHFESQLSFL